jgi:subtilase family serine protease
VVPSGAAFLVRRSRSSIGARWNPVSGSATSLCARPSAAQQAALEQLLAEQQDPASPNYHNWLTPETYAERFGASAADMDKVAAWLRFRGLRRAVYGARPRLHQFQRHGQPGAGGASYGNPPLSGGAETHFANATDSVLPAAIEPMVAGVLGLHDFHPKGAAQASRAELYRRLRNQLPGAGRSTRPSTISRPLYSYGYSGAGQNIAIVGQSDIDPTDIARSAVPSGLSPTNIQMIPTGTYPGFTAMK